MIGKDSGGEYLCPVCRDRAMAHMLGELQVRVESTHASPRNPTLLARRQTEKSLLLDVALAAADIILTWSGVLTLKVAVRPPNLTLVL